jgi:hypothetical protein
MAALSFTGCGDSGGPKTVNASGIVTLDGNALDGAQVVLIDESGVLPAYGPTDKSGKFSLRISDERSGAVPGTYKVQVSKTLMDQGNTSEGSVTLKHGVPKKYASYVTSGLTCTVPNEGTSDLKFELSSK